MQPYHTETPNEDRWTAARTRGQRWILHKLVPFAEMLAATYHVKHGLIGPPRVIDITERAATRLGELAHPSKKAVFDLMRTAKFRLKEGRLVENEGTFRASALGRYSAGSRQFGDHGDRYWSVLVQHTEAAPQNSIFLDCGVWPQFTLNRKGMPKLDAVLRASHNETVLKNLHQGLVATARMVAEQLCLVHDFQVMVALGTGDVYQIDLDRCHQAGHTNNVLSAASQQTRCVDNLRLLAAHALARLAKVEVSNGA